MGFTFWAGTNYYGEIKVLVGQNKLWGEYFVGVKISGGFPNTFQNGFTNRFLNGFPNRFHNGFSNRFPK